LRLRDVYTRGHSERVAEYAAAIAGSMGLSEESIERIRLAAQLHDLGKVGLSDSVLCKAGRLTTDEYTEVQHHPQTGAEIVERVPALAELAPIVRHHHERYDGTGYGDGLSGEDIPLESRILAVADSFDAMTSSRAYREALSSSAAFEEILACQGSQFDPGIVMHLRAAIAADSEAGSRVE
jgi:putative nucleotidyltransferase with HDIG domain